MTAHLIGMIPIFLETGEEQVALLPGTRHKLALFLHMKLGLDLYLLSCGQMLARNSLWHDMDQ